MLGGEVYRVSRDAGFGTLSRQPARVGVRLKPGEVRRRNRRADAMSSVERRGGTPQIDLEAIDPPRFHETFLLERIAISGS